ncbi:ATP-binding protein, partial [Patescibacteria group bacterium]|nr:ATP-binding protein [Patescibacteria group bacterium]
MEYLSKIWNFTKPLLNYIVNNPVESLIYVILGIFAYMILVKIFLLSYHIKQSRKLIFLRVTMARKDTAKDKEKETEKDFKEKIGVMAQFFRSINETSELNLFNIIRTRIFRNNIFSFELVCHQKQVDFYVTTPKYYQSLIEKQITSFYPDADIEPMDAYEHKPKGNCMKGYYAYTQQPYWFPIRTYKVLENDPLNNLTNLFSEMTEDETAVIQIVMRPKDDKWTKKANKIGEAYFKGKKAEGIKIPLIGPVINVLKGIFLGFDKMTMEQPQGGDGYVRMLQAKEETAKRLGEKATQSGFDTVIRLLSTATTEDRAEQLSNSLVIGLTQYKDSGSNWFQTKRLFLIDKINDIWFNFTFKHRLLDARIWPLGEKKSLLSEEEMASIFHFPHSAYNKTPIIRWMDYKVLPAPINLPKEGVVLGHNVYRGQKQEVRFMKKDRSRHHYIIGKSGSGKSALISYMARQDILNGEGVCVIDPHGDLAEDILTYVPKERAKDVIFFDPADQDRPMGLNILEANTPAEMDLVSSQATEIFIKMFGDEIFGPRIQHYFRNACLTLAEDQEEGATLIDVPRIFTDDA